MERLNSHTDKLQMKKKNCALNDPPPMSLLAFSFFVVCAYKAQKNVFHSNIYLHINWSFAGAAVAVRSLCNIQLCQFLIDSYDLSAANVNIVIWFAVLWNKEIQMFLLCIWIASLDFISSLPILHGVVHPQMTIFQFYEI